MRGGGARDGAQGILVVAGAGRREARSAGQGEHLRGQIALDQQRGTAPRLLLGGARLLDPLDVSLAREAHLEALSAAMWAGHLGRPGGVREAAEAALAAPPAPDPPRADDILLDAFALRFTQGYAAAVPPFIQPLEHLLAPDSSPSEARHRLWLVGTRGASGLIAAELWDFESWLALAAGLAQAARDMGAFVHLQFALNHLARAHLHAGEIATAAELLHEDQLIADATGNPPVAHATMMLAAWRGQEREAAALIEATAAAAIARGMGRLADFA